MQQKHKNESLPEEGFIILVGIFSQEKVTYSWVVYQDNLVIGLARRRKSIPPA